MDLNVMKSKKQAKKKKSNTATMGGMGEEGDSSSSCCCFFCAVREPDGRLRRSRLTSFFRDMPYRDDQEHVLVMSGIWSIAMAHPDDLELPSLGALRCAALLIARGLADPAWLRRHQNLYIPYYAAHILGSYTIRVPALAALALTAGALPPLLGLLRGGLTWVEQRVAVRALGHLASYRATFSAVALHGEQVVGLAMRLASTCLDTVYNDFVSLPPRRRPRYHRDLLVRGLGGAEMEDRKAEEWASQLQCWSLYLLGCFASRDRSSHTWICRDVGFLRDLSRMWGGMVNGDSPAGVGLMRILCRSEVGREAMAGCPEIVESLCNLSRSSDDWQYMGIDCLLMLLDDPITRRKVMIVAAPYLVDLSELRSLGARRKLGDSITRSLLQDFEPGCGEGAIRSLWELKVERKSREAAMAAEEVRERQETATAKKKDGNERFWSGDVEGAEARYTEALELCPLKRRRERAVLHSNRAQCRLLLRDPDAAISDATRALSLAGPANRHGKSLWRRSQAYDMKGMAKESLMDCVMFVKAWFEGGEEGRAKVPYYAARMINKQMSAVGLFAGVAARCSTATRDGDDDDGNADDDADDDDADDDVSLAAIAEKPHGRGGLEGKRKSWKGAGRKN